MLPHRKDHLEQFGLVSAFAESFMLLQRSSNKNLFQYKTWFFKELLTRDLLRISIVTLK